MPEIWKEINNYNGDYLISSHGNIVSKKWNKDKLLKLSNDKNGYLVTTFCMNGITESVKVHRLVAIHFLSRTVEKSEVNHIDVNKKNNKIENLEWVNRLENAHHSYGSGLLKNKGEENYRFKGEIIATEIKTGIEIIMKGRADIQKNGFDAANVYAALNGKYSQLRGFVFRRKNIGVLNGQFEER